MSVESTLYPLADGSYLVLPPNTRVRFVGSRPICFGGKVEMEARRLEEVAQALRMAAKDLETPIGGR